jgi:hypothetical protein
MCNRCIHRSFADTQFTRGGAGTVLAVWHPTILRELHAHRATCALAAEGSICVSLWPGAASPHLSRLSSKDLRRATTTRHGRQTGRDGLGLFLGLPRITS